MNNRQKEVTIDNFLAAVDFNLREIREVFNTLTAEDSKVRAAKAINKVLRNHTVEGVSGDDK